FARIHARGQPDDTVLLGKPRSLADAGPANRCGGTVKNRNETALNVDHQRCVIALETNDNLIDLLWGLL
ncbi:MAG: hypothetical protein AAGB48_11085, partial [Planctomycetota bacterium]